MTRRHLFIAPQSVHEAILMQPAIAAHQKAHPDAKLDAVANQDVAPVMEAIPQFDDLILIPQANASRLRGAWRLADVLRDRHYTCSYNLDSQGGAALAPWMARIPERHSFRADKRTETLSRVEQYYRFVCGADNRAAPATLPVPRLTPSPSAAAAVTQQLSAHFPGESALSTGGRAATSQPLIVMAPGAGGPAKQWPSRHFARLAAMITSHWPSARIALTGDSSERTLCTEIATLSATNVFNLAGQMTPVQRIALLQAADVVVCNDSDALHLAAACTTHLVAVYGASSPNAEPPLTIGAQVHWLELTCSPCNAMVCPLAHTNCLNLLEPVRVFNSIERVVQATDPSRPVS